MRDRLYPGGIFHVYARGNNKETLFKAAENYPYFLGLWKAYVNPVAEAYAYCLLPNHLHFCLRIREEKELPLAFAQGHKRLSQAFSNCFNAYAKAINKAFDRSGSLFEGRFGRKEVADDAYLLGLIGYIHANPQHHGFCADFRTYPHSSYRSLLSERPTALAREELLAYFGRRQGFIDFHADQKHWRDFLAEEE